MWGTNRRGFRKIGRSALELSVWSREQTNIYVYSRNGKIIMYDLLIIFKVYHLKYYISSKTYACTQYNVWIVDEIKLISLSEILCRSLFFHVWVTGFPVRIISCHEVLIWYLPKADDIKRMIFDKLLPINIYAVTVN